MRHIKPNESIVMQEFERIAAKEGWLTEKKAQEPGPNLGLVKEPHMTQPWQYPMGPELNVEPESYIKQIQRRLSDMGPIFRKTLATKQAPDGVDGVWGKNTLAALSALAPLVPELTDVVSGLSPNREPGITGLQKIIGILDNMSRIERPVSEGVPDYLSNVPKKPLDTSTLTPKSDNRVMDFAKELMKGSPEKYPSLDIALEQAKQTLGVTSAVVNELVALANDLDEMGEIKTAETVDKELILYKQAVDKFYDITGETGEQLIEEAHPGGGTTMVPATDEGGKFETIVEQQKKDLEVVNKKPTGKQAVFIVQQLVALANRLDAEGKTEAALLVDKTLNELREGSQRPFVIKKALWGVVALIDRLLKTLKDWAVHEPEYYRRIKTNLESLKSYQDKIYNAEKANRTEEVAHLMATLDKDFPTIEESLFAGAPLGTRPLIGQYIQGIKTNLAYAAEQYPKLFGYTPPPMAGKADKARKTEGMLGVELKRAYDNFRGTLSSFSKRLLAARENPTTEKKLDVLFGGDGKTVEMIDALNKLYDNATMPKTMGGARKLEQQTLELWNNYIKPLMARGLIALSSIGRYNIKREAISTLPLPGKIVSPLGQTTPDKASPVKTKLRRPSARAREDIRQLQEIMRQIPGMPSLGTTGKNGNGVDGVWGKHTKEAWEMLRSWTQNKGFGEGPPAIDRKGPSEIDVKRALRVAQYQLERQQGSFNIPIAGVDLPLTVFRNTATFLRALARKGKIQQDVLSDNLNTTINRKIAADILRGFIDEMDDTGATALIANFDKASISQIIQQVNVLLTEFSKPVGPPDLPSTQGKPGISGVPGAPGVSSVPGAPRPPSKALSGRPEPEMSVVNRIYSIPENIPTTSTQQLLYWASAYWQRNSGKIPLSPAQSSNWVAIARAVIAYLRTELGNLANESEVVRNLSLQVAVRKREQLLDEAEDRLRGL